MQYLYTDIIIISGDGLHNLPKNRRNIFSDVFGTNQSKPKLESKREIYFEIEKYYASADISFSYIFKRSEYYKTPAEIRQANNLHSSKLCD